MSSSTTILYALLGGIIPAIFWLWFWLQEDKRRPEPRGRIALVFFLGMLAVLIALPVEKYVQSIGGFLGGFTIVIIIWAIAEEILKWLAAHFGALRSSDLDEPIDAVIYMITAALGFAALENTFFLIDPVHFGNLNQSIVAGNMRFIGATLLHVISSATIGVFIAISFYKRKSVRRAFLYTGIIVSILLHSLFNLFIIRGDTGVFSVFILVWWAIIALILIFEKLKRIRPAG